MVPNSDTMTNGTKRGQFMRSSSNAIPCLSPAFAFFISSALVFMIGYHSWSQSHRLDNCRFELVHLRGLLQSSTQRRIKMEGRISELHVLIDRRTKLLTHMNVKDDKSWEKHEDKDKKILSLENELLQAREKVERCNAMGFKSQSRIDESESNVRSTLPARNKTMCETETTHQYEEIDKWIKSMVDDRTYSQFQLKFSRELVEKNSAARNEGRGIIIDESGERNEADKQQKLEKVVMQRDEIKAMKDERIKEEIRARESKINEPAQPATPPPTTKNFNSNSRSYKGRNNKIRSIPQKIDTSVARSRSVKVNSKGDSKADVEDRH